ncbi:hypothetical protein CHU98_g8019 [Xylaria longipes]|nr:hypothetical protein CHU98_g8019 [Xylaria longipes]
MSIVGAAPSTKRLHAVDGGVDNRRRPLASSAVHLHCIVTSRVAGPPQRKSRCQHGHPTRCVVLGEGREDAVGGMIRPAPKIDWRAAACGASNWPNHVEDHTAAVHDSRPAHPMNPRVPAPRQLKREVGPIAEPVAELNIYLLR